MNRRGAGLGLIGIAAFLFAARYITAAIFGSAVVSWDADLFAAMYGYVGSGLTTAAAIALVVGIAYLVMGELTEVRKRGDGSEG